MTGDLFQFGQADSLADEKSQIGMTQLLGGYPVRLGNICIVGDAVKQNRCVLRGQRMFLPLYDRGGGGKWVLSLAGQFHPQ